MLPIISGLGTFRDARIAFKPLKAIHFYPFYEKATRNSPHENKIDYFMHGKNIMGKILMTPRLKKIFNKHGLK